MARIAFKTGDEYALKLSHFTNHSEEIAKRALYAAANIVADKIRANLESLPEEAYRRLGIDEMFDGIPRGQKDDLVSSFGVTPIQLGEDGWWTVKVGFDGYGRFPTRLYPNGLPNQLLARAIESGSSVRQKHPFVRPAVNAMRKSALEAMQRVVNEETEKIMKG